ncbi:unnamed protein product [Dimorphilus gyrociliatus]|uniref:Uncharacterized protein n=1 Tax=Dimorphilus gyrociliatus TaxID=2664684 RepID=A0A7I8VED4_9ANNE|nr:unnamed protein product [Dimorphilus gyrociliatus]
MTHYFGPESPRPFAVLRESGASSSSDLPSYGMEDDIYSFGIDYELRMCQLVHKHLELGTNDKLCYIGEDKGSLAPLLTNRFGLLQEPTVVFPGRIQYEEDHLKRRVAIPLANIGAEDFFKESSDQFDKIALVYSINFIDDLGTFLCNAMDHLKDDGRLVVIERKPEMNTLPLFKEAKNKLMENELEKHDYSNIIKCLQAARADVSWEVELLNIRMPKAKWFNQLRSRFPSPLEMFSDLDIEAGIRELNDGMLKYCVDSIIEFTDRLLFITGSKTSPNRYPSIQRFGSSLLSPHPDMKAMNYSMKATPELMKYLPKKRLPKLGEY